MAITQQHPETDADAPVSTPSSKNASGSWIRRAAAGVGGPFIGLVFIFAVFSVFAPNFLTPNNLVNVLGQVTVLGILALGATAVILTGGIDLSVGAVMALSGMVLGWLSHDGGWPLWGAMIACVIVGGLAGMLNGLAVTFASLPPFIATLAMMSVARGLANLVTNGQNIVGFPAWFSALSTQRYAGYFTVTLLGAVVLFVIGWAVLKYRAAGRSVYAVGGNSEVARLAGIKVRSVTTWVYVIAGATAGLAAIVTSSRLDSAQPSAGDGIELNVIAAVVIGGASLVGGVGRVMGTVVGVLIIGVLNNGLNLLGISPFIQQVVIGLVIALAVFTDVLRRRRARTS